MSAKQRIEEFLGQQSPFSRRQIFDAMTSGDVLINGKKTDKMGQLIIPEKDKVMLFGKQILNKAPKLYYKFNKAKNVISSVRDPKERTDLSMFMKKLEHPLFPIGRLDRLTSGLMIFTNDGQFANQILHPKYHIEKEYFLRLKKPISQKHCQKLLSGFFLDDGPVRFDHVEKVSKTELVVIISEGRNRLIRRSFSELGNEVISLKRRRIGPFELGALKEGEFKKLSKSELYTWKKESKKQTNAN
tara:strand:+ start:1531 stop:2262 length:732 start_codon:yes stop_codon:yes gene_type:complete